MSSLTPSPDDRSIDELIAEFKALYALAEETRQKMNQLSAQIAQRTAGVNLDPESESVSPTTPTS